VGWKDLAELAPTLSEAELRAEKRKRLIGLILGPALFAAMLVSPPLPHVTDSGMRTLGVFLWTITWWVTEAIPIPAASFFGMAMLVVCGSLTVEGAFNNWAYWVNIFLIGGCIIGHAMNRQGLTQRIAYWLISTPIASASPYALLMVFAIAQLILSSVLSHVVTTVVFVSIALGLVDTLKLPLTSRYSEALFLVIAWGSAFGILTPIGTPPNMITIGFVRDILHYRIGWAAWFMACLPVALVGIVAIYLVTKFVQRPEIPHWSATPDMIRAELRQMGPMKRGEKIAGGALLTALVLWSLPDTLPLMMPGGPTHPLSIWVRTHLDWSVTSILVATSLFLIPVDWPNRKFVMTWDEAVKGIEWGTLALIGAALAMASAIANKQVGLGEFFNQSLGSMGQAGQSQLWLVFGIISFTIIAGSFISNVATISMVGGLIAAIAPSTGVNPVALLVSVGIASSMDFSLPVGNPPNAIVFASGRVKVGSMVKGGVVLSFLCIFLITFIAFPLANWMFPWPLEGAAGAALTAPTVP
jgi:solute carrier family 13 (sodium-dependent dicarboxylate transporter), member 2/3/5